jgi:hydantoinase/carbamoylase family amidase
MPIKPARISRDIDTLAVFSESAASIGFSRPTFSKPWRQARDYIIAQAEAAGCKTRIDAFGNVHARPKKFDWGGNVWLSGSHLDSVPTGGKFDGVVGVVCALEVLRVGHEAGKIIPLELMVFAEQQGSTFGTGTPGSGAIGSRLWTGDADIDLVQSLKNKAGQNYFQDGEPHGVRPAAFAADRLDPSHYRGMIEIHIEQGPGMWRQGTPIGVVAAIAGRQQYTVELKGEPNHAGSTAMSMRCDALTAAARVILDLERMAGELSEHMIATVGRIECQPNLIDIIPGSVKFSVDLRSPSADDLYEAHNRLAQMIRQSAANDATFIKTEEQPVVEMDVDLVGELLQICGEKTPTVISGISHDAGVVAPHLPTAMLFVSSRDGITNHPAEFSRIEDIAVAATVLGKLVSLQ